MKPINANRERGAALLAMLAVIMLAASWYLVSQLNAETDGRSAVSQNRTAEALNRAKLALIGYIAAQAAEAGEGNPGRLPCPEAAGNIDGVNDGITAGNCGTLLTPTAIGRFPWRTLGTDKLVDARGEPLWYVVSPGWALSNSTTPPLTTYINSNSNGQLLVNAKSVSSLSRSAGTATVVSTAHGFRTGDIVKIAGAVPAGYNVAASVTVTNANTFTYAIDSTLSTPATGSIKAGDAVVALIIAPGQAMNVAASANCTARNQARSVPAPTINALDYLECYDAANGVFFTTGPSGSFNDQVLVVTAADVMPAIEAAIANRIEREIVPGLNSVYAPSVTGFSMSRPMYPYAAPFANPGFNTGAGSNTGTSSYLGVAGTYRGLLPFNQTECTATASNPRCLPTLIAWQGTPSSPVEELGFGYIQGTPSCSWDDATAKNYRQCTGEYHENNSNPSRPIQIAMTATLNNVAMGLRMIDTTKITVEARDDTDTTGPWTSVTPTYALTMNTNGSVTITFRATLPNIDVKGWGSYADFRMRIYRTVFGDHTLLDTTNATTGWFARNEWYRLLYYAVARGHTADKSAPVCPTTSPFNSSCLSVANVTPANAQRAILILAGRSINGTARPSSTLADYLEFGNATAAFERQPVSLSVAAALKKPFNDRIVVVGSN